MPNPVPDEMASTEINKVCHAACAKIQRSFGPKPEKNEIGLSIAFSS
jgi:hypothetical protein